MAAGGPEVGGGIPEVGGNRPKAFRFNPGIKCAWSCNGKIKKSQCKWAFLSDNIQTVTSCLVKENHLPQKFSNKADVSCDTLEQIVHICSHFLVFKIRVLVCLLLDLKPHGVSQGSSELKDILYTVAHGTYRQSCTRWRSKRTGFVHCKVNQI